MNKSDDTIIKEVFSYINKLQNTPAVEAITDYCFRNDIEVEYVGALIANYDWFTQYVKNDCRYNENKNKILDW